MSSVFFSRIKSIIRPLLILLILQVLFCCQFYINDPENYSNFMSIVPMSFAFSILPLFASVTFGSSLLYGTALSSIMMIGIAFQSMVGDVEDFKTFVPIALIFSALLVPILNFWNDRVKNNKTACNIITWCSTGLIAVICLLMRLRSNNTSAVTAWIKIGSFQFQITTVLILAFVVAQAACYYYSFDPDRQKSWLVKSAIITAITGVSYILFVSEGGTFIVLCLAYIIECFFLLSDMRLMKRAVIISGIIVLVASVVLMIASFFITSETGILGLIHSFSIKVTSRFFGFFNVSDMSEKITGDNGQIDSALEAVRIGGLLGEKTRHYIPMSKSDMCFAYLCCRLGSLIGLLVTIAFCVIFSCGIFGYESSENPVVVILSAAIVFSQFILAASSSTKLFPVMGVGLPLISEGGTAFITFTLLGMIGIFSSNSDTYVKVDEGNDDSIVEVNNE